MRVLRSPQELGTERLAPKTGPGQLNGRVQTDIFQQHSQHHAPLKFIDEEAAVMHLEPTVAEPAQALPCFLGDPGPTVPMDGKARQDKAQGSRAGHAQALRQVRRRATTASRVLSLSPQPEGAKHAERMIPMRDKKRR